LQQGIFTVSGIIVPAVHVAHDEASTPKTTSSDASPRLHRTMPSIVCLSSGDVNEEQK
jgi:hypothetical protein